MNEKGLTLVFTGNGKGKTTAALGMAFRAVGHGMKVCVVQFLKSPDSGYGEITMMNKMGIENHQAGAGCTWNVPAEDTRRTVKEAWQLAREKVMSDEYDMVVLDEINNAVALPEPVGDKIIFPEDVVALIEKKPTRLHLVLTGRSAHALVIDKADMVSEINCIKHHYNNGMPAMEGIEF